MGCARLQGFPTSFSFTVDPFFSPKPGLQALGIIQITWAQISALVIPLLGEVVRDSNVPELLTEILQQNSAQERLPSDNEEEGPAGEQPQQNSPGGASAIDDSDEEAPAHVDPEVQAAEDAKIREQLREAQKVIQHLQIWIPFSPRWGGEGRLRSFIVFP